MKKLESMRRLPLREDNNIVISFRMTEKCNHTCHYCNRYDNSVPFMDYNEALFLFSQIKKYVHKDEYHFYFTGGEPTIYPNFKDLLQEVYEMYEGKAHFQVQSNTTRPMSWYEDLVKRPYANYYRTSASYQNHQVKDKESWKANVAFLHEHKILDNIDFMLEDEKFDEVIEMYKYLKKHPYTVHMSFVNHTRMHADKYAEILEKGTDLGERYLLKFDDGSSEIMSHTMIRTSEINNFKMMKCDAGMKNIVLDTNGDVSICYTHIQSATLPKINLYKNPEKLTKLTSRPSICLWSKCDCELWLDKYK